MNTKIITVITLFAAMRLAQICSAETVSLYTDVSTFGDSNWDYWQQDQSERIQEDAIYLGMYDGANGHSNYQPEYPADGSVDGLYSTMSMGAGGAAIYQSLGVSGTDPEEFPYDQRDTRMACLFNLTKIMELNSNPSDINDCKFKWSIDYVMPWAGSTTYLMAPTTLYIGIYSALQQNYWRSDIDGDDFVSTDMNDLQNEFDPNELLYVEKEFDLCVDNGPWGVGIQPLTNWYIEQYGVQFYEVDFTEEVKELLALEPEKYSDPNTAFIGITVRCSLDGESVYLSMDAQNRLSQNPIPPTFEIELTTYTGDFNADGSVNLSDFDIFAVYWQSEINDANYNSKCNLDDDGSSQGRIDIADLRVLVENWLDAAES